MLQLLCGAVVGWVALPVVNGDAGVSRFRPWPSLASLPSPAVSMRRRQGRQAPPPPPTPPPPHATVDSSNSLWISLNREVFGAESSNSFILRRTVNPTNRRSVSPLSGANPAVHGHSSSCIITYYCRSPLSKRQPTAAAVAPIN